MTDKKLAFTSIVLARSERSGVPTPGNLLRYESVAAGECLVDPGAPLESDHISEVRYMTGINAVTILRFFDFVISSKSSTVWNSSEILERSVMSELSIS